MATSVEDFNVPQVTSEDLRLFHNNHFPSWSPHVSGTEYDADSNSEEVDGEDNRLGYYPDGVKRTLTDEQVAMFRHSEIQVLLRERRRERENADNESVSEVSNLSRHPVGDTNAGTGNEAVEQPSLSASDPHQPGKRKWQRFIDASDSNPEHLTHRRIARELDEQKTNSIDLAYGDEESAHPPLQKRSEGTANAAGSRRQVAYYDTEKHDHPQSIPEAKSQTPKFLWPALGAQGPT